MLWIIILIFIFIWLWGPQKELFRSYNDYYSTEEEKTYIDKYLVPNITNIITSIHSKNTTSLKVFLPQRVNYTPFLYYLDFNLSSSFKQYIQRYLQNLGYTVNIPLKLTDIYIENNPGITCMFYFHCNINFNSINSSLPFYVLLKVNNIQKYIVLNNYTHNLIDLDDMSILFMENTDNLNNTTSVKPSKSYLYDDNEIDIDTLYRTKNTLYLLDPFYTSTFQKS
jgi:hypothetical protein